MQRIHATLVGLTAAAVAVVVLAPSARAQMMMNTIDADTLGAAVFVPWEVGEEGGQITVATVTNALTMEAVTLHAAVLDEEWRSHDFTCPLTPLETTYFVFDRDEETEQVRVTFECSDWGPHGGKSKTNNIFTNFAPNGAERGVMFISVECQQGSNGCPGGVLGNRTKGDNALLADATVIDLEGGFAYSVNAVHVQGNGENDGDRLYEFDGEEYQAFPSALAANYIAPDEYIETRLILFTPDGKANDPSAGSAFLFGFAFDDDENATSGGLEIKCYANVDLEEMFGSFVRSDVNGHLVGHLELFPTHLGGQMDANETNPETGDSNFNRKRPVHGWLVHFMAAEGTLGDETEAGPFPSDEETVMESAGAWARTLVQGTNPLMPIGDDTPALAKGPNGLD